MASLAGAIWAFVEARKAATAATQVEKLHEELIHLRKTAEVSVVYSETKKILLNVSKVGPSCIEKHLKGLDCSEIAKEVLDYTSLLIEQSEHFSEYFQNNAIKLCSDLKNDIEGLSEAITFNDKKKFGKGIYYKIQTFLPTAKELSDKKRERALQ